MHHRAINLANIRVDASTQTRVGVTEEVVSDYAERMAAGDLFPPVDVFFDGLAYHLADGFHRVLAAKRAKLTAVQCAVHPGTLRNALWFAIGANRENGLHRTARDKRRAIETALGVFVDKTQQQIALHVGCSQQYVATIQMELTSSCKLKLPASRTGKDGKIRPVKYKSRKPVKTSDSPPAAPLQQAVVAALATATQPASSNGSKGDFTTVVRKQFSQWMGRWALADLPEVKNILREVLKQ